jgi:3-oxoacyl-[acyl-carrier-protein] synthase-3
LKYRHVGLESWGVYLPKQRHTSKYISKETGIPEEIIIEKFGLKNKTIPGSEDHTVQMGANASFQALERANLTPEDLDVIIWAGEVHAERLLVVNGIKLQGLLGNPKRPWAFDVNQRCGTFLLGMLVAKSLIQTDPMINRILVASGYRNSDLINYKNPRSRFMISLAASGVAAIVRGDYRINQILGISAITDSRFVDDVYIPAGGTIQPMTAEALEQAGYKREDIDYLALLHMKRSAFEYVAKTIGVDPYTQSTYFEDIGHNGQNDGIISIEYGIKENKIKNGDIVVIVSAGIGWAWNAGVIKWGEL